MCGIYGYISTEDKNLSWSLNRLEILEYRGYHSSGISSLTQNGFDIYKSTGYISNLYKEVKSKKGKNVICHTRWATHGKISTENSHPHKTGDVCIVHNGIIDNYNELKKTYNLQDVLKSDCDSEIISAIIDIQISKYNKDIFSIIDALCALNGSYATLIQIAGLDNIIFGAKNKSPLYIGKSSHGYIFSSDLIAFQGIVKEYYELDDGEVFVTTANDVKFFNLYKLPLNKSTKKYEDINFSSSIGKFSCFLEKEINDIPKALCDTLFNYQNETLNIPNLTNYECLHLVACGTAYHSALMGKYIIERHLKIPCYCHIASEFLYENFLEQRKCLFVFISQSGETFDTLQCVKKVKNLKYKTLAITNTKHSQITKICDYCLPIYAGKEVSVASTKVYNCTILAFFYLCKAKNLQIDAKLLFKIINRTDEKNLAEKMCKAKNILFIGKCEDYVTSLEASLKFRELTYQNCASFACGELKHGTLSVVDCNALVIAYLTDIKYAPAINTALQEVKARGGKTALITSIEGCNNYADIIINLETNKTMPIELYSIIPMQKIALFACQNLCLTPDKPRNLAKSVTVQ